MDVLIVGGGPGGLFMAARLAERGVRTLVCEEHARVGDPVHCTGVLSAESFDEFDLPRDRDPESADDGALRVARRHSRRLHDADAARHGHRSSGLRPRAGRPGDRRRRRGPRRARACRALEADAAGVRATVGGDDRARAPGGARLRRELRVSAPVRPRPADHAICRRRSASCPRARPGDVELHFGQDVAPGRVRVGRAGAAPRGRVRAHRRDGVARHPRLLRAHARPGRRPLGRRRARDAAAAPEDPAARRDRPHLRRPPAGDRRRRRPREADDRRRHSLQHPERRAGRATSPSTRWRPIGSTPRRCPPTSARGARELADEFEAQQALREVATSLSDEAIDSFFELAHTDGIMPIVRATARFNEHRPLIRALFKHPPARRILFRAMMA